MKLTTRFLLIAFASVLLARPGIAQTHAGLLERGIFLEETAGDLDGAVRVYRGLLATRSVADDIQQHAAARLNDITHRRGASGPSAAGHAQATAPSAGQGCCGMFSDNYDVNRPVAVSGKVAMVQWVNPQSFVVIDGFDGRRWGFTIAAPNQMLRFGMNKNTFKLGEQVLVTGYQAKGAGDNCPTALPNACAMLQTGSALAAAAGLPPPEKPPAPVMHASAGVIVAEDGRVLFDRIAMELQAAANPQQ
jgi:hypothetical protein